MTAAAASGRSAASGRHDASGRRNGISSRRLRNRTLFALAVLLGSLAVVAWRQSAVQEIMQKVDAAERELAVVVDRRETLRREVAAMETRPWVGEEAARRLDMRPPQEHEVVITTGGAP